jgi:uncharacterized protein YwgA
MTTDRTSLALRVCYSIYMLGFAGLVLLGPEVDPDVKLVLSIINLGIVILFSVSLTRSRLKALRSRFREEDAAYTEISANHRQVEDRLDDLERLKRRDMVTPEEYAAKRQEILKDL